MIRAIDRDAAAYFSEMTREELDAKIFPAYPALFNAVARGRGIGAPSAYRAACAKAPPSPTTLFFEANLGRQYTGNPRYIYERMLQRFPDWRYIWCYHGQTRIPGDPEIVQRATPEYYEALASAGGLVNNTVFPVWHPRPESFYLQTWHGTPFKRLHWDIETRPLEKRSEPSFYAKSTRWDALLSPNRFASGALKSAFRYEGAILEFGYPANDIFFDDARMRSARARVRARLGITGGGPVYLYAPTWRDGQHLGGAKFAFDLMLDVEGFLKRAPADATLLIRAHHMSEAGEGLSALAGRAIDVSGEDDAAEMMCAADVLITDYSSIVFDWYCSKRPVLYFVPDYEYYTQDLRGSYFELKAKHAGPICSTNEELFDHLDCLTAPVNQAFYDEFCDLHDGRAADRAIDYLIEKLGLGL